MPSTHTPPCQVAGCAHVARKHTRAHPMYTSRTDVRTDASALGEACTQGTQALGVLYGL